MSETGPIVPEVINAGGAGQLLLVCEHASNHFPERYGALGLEADVVNSHVAWDPGARSVAGRLSRHLDAPLVAARVSRLLYDCNRPPEAPDAMPEKSEVFEIPGNRGLSEAQRRERIEHLYLPFKDALAGLIAGSERPRVLVTIHSFTPVYFGKRRAVDIGVLHDSDSRLADAMLDCARDFTDLDVRRNEPYGPEHGVTHTLIEHGLCNGLANAMIEIRNDLLRSEQDEAAMSDMLAVWLRAACGRTDIENSGKG